MTTALLVAAAISAALAFWLMTKGKEWHAALPQALALGFSLPLAFSLLALLPLPDAAEGFFGELWMRFLIVLVVTPQVIVQFFGGIVVWMRFLKSGASDTGTGWALALALVAAGLLGQFWTYAILSAGPVSA